MIKRIYYPDILERGKAASYSNTILSKHGSFVETYNYDLLYKIKMWYGISKIIELSFDYDLIYLDSIDFIFIIKEIINNHNNIASVIIKKISFIDSANFNLSYKKSKDNKWSIIITGNKLSQGDINNRQIKEITDDSSILCSIKKSIDNSILLDATNIEEMAKKCNEEIIFGYYQFLGITDTNIILINDTNKAVFDLILLNYRNNFICDRAGIECIYKNSFEENIEEYRLSYLFNISLSHSVINVNKTNNIFPAFMNEKVFLDYDNKLINGINIKKYPNILLTKIEYRGMYKNLKEAISYKEKEEIGDSIDFIFSDESSKKIKILSFEDFFGKLNKIGECIRTSKLYIKITKRKYALDFIKKGQLKFTQIFEWVKEFNENPTSGRSDCLEGTINAIVEENKITRVYRDKDMSALYNYCWCCLSLDNLHFAHREEINGINFPKAIIDRKYFEDFEDKPKDGSIPKYEDEQVALLINPSIFMERLTEYLKSNGFNDFLISPVIYVPKTNKKVVLNCKYPFELFYKDFRYINQREVRCILPRNNSKFYKMLDDSKGIIEIGSLSDAAIMIEYDKNDLAFILENENVAVYHLPKPVIRDFGELDFNELINTFIDYFIRKGFIIRSNELDSFNSILEKKYLCRLSLDGTELLFQDNGMSNKNSKILNDALKRIELINILNEINNLCDKRDVQSLKNIVLKYRNDEYFSNILIYVESLIEFYNKNYAKALELIEKYQGIVPFNQYVFYNKIKILFEMGNYFSAYSLCEKSISLFNSNQKFICLKSEIEEKMS